MRVSELDTPCLTVDLDAFERNLELGMARFGAVSVRPHLKTAKSPDVARLLLDGGAVGICVAKLGEAEVMLAGGIGDVLITTELVGPPKLQRLEQLRASRPEARIRIVVDSWEGASQLEAALSRPIETLIDVNVGQNRTGLAPEHVLGLADRIGELERLTLVGLQGYEGNLQHVRDLDARRALCDRAMERLSRVADELRGRGHAIDTVTTGGTGTAEFCARHDAVTEVQPGSFLFMDGDYLDTEGVPYERSLVAVATVISHADPDRAILDAGLKTLSNDSGSARLADAPGWTYAPAGDEHGTLTPAQPGVRRRALAIGDRVELVPSHIDTTINLHDVMYAHRDGIVAATWQIAARGRIQ